MSAFAVIAPLTALVLGAAKLAKGSIKAVDELRFDIGGKPRISFKLTHCKVTLPVKLINSQGTPIFFDSIYAKALWNTTAIGTTTYGTRTIVPARGDAVVDLPFTIPFGAVVTAMFQAWKAKKLGTATLSGTVKAGVLSFDFKQDYALSNPQPGTTH